MSGARVEAHAWCCPLCADKAAKAVADAVTLTQQLEQFRVREDERRAERVRLMREKP